MLKFLRVCPITKQISLHSFKPLFFSNFEYCH